MENRRKLLLAVIVFAALSNINSEQLDMAPNAVDYQYDTCQEKPLERVIRPGLLNQELLSSKIFSKTWNESSKCLNSTTGGIEEQAIAVLTYFIADKDLKKTFNSEVKTLGVNATIYENSFNFKSLHFLLMRSMMRQQKCKTVYFVKEQKYTATIGSNVRFGTFNDATDNFDTLKKEEDLTDIVIFNVTSCFYVSLEENGCTDTNYNNILLSPPEVFTVESVNTIKDTEKENDYDMIVLNHSTVKSFNKCYISWSPAHIPNRLLVLVLVAFSLFFF